MFKYKLIKVERKSALLDPYSSYETFILTYLRKNYIFFGLTKKVKCEVDCPNYQISSWLSDIEQKIKKGEWRKN